jgi:hypothetical protein
MSPHEIRSSKLRPFVAFLRLWALQELEAKLQDWTPGKEISIYIHDYVI